MWEHRTAGPSPSMIPMDITDGEEEYGPTDDSPSHRSTHWRRRIRNARWYANEEEYWTKPNVVWLVVFILFLLACTGIGMYCCNNQLGRTGITTPYSDLLEVQDGSSRFPKLPKTDPSFQVQDQPQRYRAGLW